MADHIDHRAEAEQGLATFRQRIDELSDKTRASATDILRLILGHAEVHALLAIADAIRGESLAATVPPGPCTSSISGFVVVGGKRTTIRCELRFGHAGDHEVPTGLGGATRWNDADAAALTVDAGGGS